MAQSARGSTAEQHSSAEEQLSREMRAQLAAITGGLAPDDYAQAWWEELHSYRAHSATRRLPRFLIGHPVLSVQQAAAGLNISVPAANAALNNLLAAGIVSLVNERQWGRVFQATPVLRRLDQLPAPRQGP